MTKLFTQCRLMRLDDGSKARLVSWIPAHTAVAGYTVMLKENREDTPKFFKVLETYHTVEQGVLEQIRKNGKDHRSATDI